MNRFLAPGEDGLPYEIFTS